MSSSKRLVLIDQAAVSGTGFLTTVVLVRSLGLGVFGSFALVELGALFALSLQQSLLGQPLLTFAPKESDEDRPSYFAAALRLELLFTLLLTIFVAGAFGFFLNNWDAPAIAGTWIPVTLTIVTRQLFAYLRSECFATGRVKRALSMDIVAYPAALGALTVVWMRDEMSLPLTFWVLGGASGIACLLALPGVAGRGAKPHSLRETGAKHWSFARWLAAMSVAQFFASNSFLVAAAVLLGTPAAGAIKAAQRVMGVLHLGFLAMENVVPVSAARLLVAEGVERFRSYMLRVLTLGLMATVVTSAGIAICARFVLDLVYEDAVDELMVLGLRAMAALYIASFTITVLQIGFRTLENTRVVFGAYIVNTVVAVLAAHPIVERFGYEGAVWGMAAQQGLMAALLLIAWRRSGITSARSSSA